MLASKSFSGLNENALRLLLPRWMSAWSGVAMRLGFGAIAFWIIGIFKKPAVKLSWRMKLLMVGIGAVFMTGYMTSLLLGLTYTTPVVSSIFISTEPVWVFILSVIFFREKITGMKIWGILLGLGGALLCILTTRHSALATRPWLGALFCLLDALLYSGYLIISSRLLKGIDSVTVSKWTFLGGAISSWALIALVGWDAPVLHQPIGSLPVLALLFILIFPTVVSYFLLDIGLATLPATVVSLYGYVILIVATIVSYFAGQDRFDWFQILAIAMIVASVYFVEVAEKRTAPVPPKLPH